MQEATPRKNRTELAQEREALLDRLLEIDGKDALHVRMLGGAPELKVQIVVSMTPGSPTVCLNGDLTADSSVVSDGFRKEQKVSAEGTQLPHPDVIEKLREYIRMRRAAERYWAENEDLQRLWAEIRLYEPSIIDMLGENPEIGGYQEALDIISPQF